MILGWPWQALNDPVGEFDETPPRTALTSDAESIVLEPRQPAGPHHGD